MVIITVDPKEAYDKKKFLDAMQDYSELESLVNITRNEQGLQEEGRLNPDIRKNLGSLLNNNPTYYAGMPGDIVINDSKEAYEDSKNNIVGYSGKNFVELLDSLDAQGLLSMIMSIHLEKTGNQIVDKIAEAIIEKKEVEKVARGEKNPSEYVARKIKESKEEWRQRAFSYSGNNERSVNAAFNSYAQQAEIDFAKAITNTKTKKLDGDKLYNLVKTNYDHILKVKKKGKESDEARKYHNLVAKHAYESLKK